MAERPILFNGEMVRAILAGTKTVTRRPVKPQPDCDGLSEQVPGFFVQFKHDSDGPFLCGTTVKAPARVGDLLYVRETFNPAYFGRRRPAYRADWSEAAEDLVPAPRWTPSIHMPKWAARIWLRVTAVRVERLQELGAEDVFREGKRPCGWGRVLNSEGKQHRPVLDGEAERTRVQMINDFATRLWDGTYGNQPGLSWNANPWVWVIEFERVEAP